jgi:putative hydrolase of the HAD superfamily
MTRPVVFDFGGVVFRWQPLALLQEVLPERARDEHGAREAAAALFQSFTPDSDWAEFDLGRVDATGLAQRIARRTGFAEHEVRRVIDAVPGHLQAQQDTVALMRRLREAGCALYYLSNMPAPYADHLERANDFFAWFDGGLFSGRVGRIKPHADMFALAQERFGIDPAASTFIDDHRGNVEAARALGWRAIHFRDARQCAAELEQGGWL